MQERSETSSPTPARLRARVEHICHNFPRRHVWNPTQLDACLEWIEIEVASMGLASTRQAFEASYWIDDRGTPATRTVANLCVEIPGASRPDETIVVGAHYDSRVGMDAQHARRPKFDWSSVPDGDPKREFMDTPGANDNASGVAALLSLLEMLRARPLARTLCAVFWVNEEYPFFRHTFARGVRHAGATLRARGMGSLHHAQTLAAEGRPVIGAIALDSLGCYAKTRGYHTGELGRPARLAIPAVFPARHDYVALLSDRRSAPWAAYFARAMRRALGGADSGAPPLRVLRRSFPLVGALGHGWSDDWAYWKHRVPAFCITDTAYIRSRNYHRVTDTPETLNYSEFARVVGAIAAAVGEVCGKTR
ncbi:MAG: M20/M25/M40 family metallo-hydrolase [Phycisphaerales bacterium]|nr:M20/M25/M40 family metallo-hydrolase [Phycisphaerales bacterium]